MALEAIECFEAVDLILEVVVNTQEDRHSQGSEDYVELLLWRHSPYFVPICLYANVFSNCFPFFSLRTLLHNFATRFQSTSLKGDGGYVQEVGIGNKDVFRDPGRAFR